MPGYTLYYIRCRTPLHFYVGITKKPWERWEQHRRREGSEFTRQHGVIQVYRMQELGSCGSDHPDLEEFAHRALQAARLAEWDFVQQLREEHPDWVVAGAGATDATQHSDEVWSRNSRDPDCELAEWECTEWEEE